MEGRLAEPDGSCRMPLLAHGWLMRLLAVLAFCLLALAPARAQNPPQESLDEFRSFLASVWPAARQAGVSRMTFESATAGLTPDPAILARPARQGEFSMKISDYIAQTVTAGRVAEAGRRARANGSALGAVERRSGVPREIVLALWAVESNFGTHQGSTDVLRALATHAVRQHRPEMFRDEFVAALAMIEKGAARRDRLRGSWAGAMGQPQFMPSSYLKYAVSLSGDEWADIWTSADDSIASIANFMKESGWRPGLPAVVEAAIPPTFDWKPLDLDFSRWRALGFRRADGGELPAAGSASLYLPEGASGPAFLLTENWEAIRQYNTSDAYALSVALIAQRIAGGALVRPFPKGAASLSLTDRVAAQKGLAAKGFYDGVSDGKIGRKTRVAVHAFQIARGVLPADGFLDAELVRALKQ